jgi:hypothetical protein
METQFPFALSLSKGSFTPCQVAADRFETKLDMNGRKAQRERISTGSLKSPG